MTSLSMIIFYVLAIDSIVANILAWSGRDWYIKHFRLLSRYFPVTKGWTTYYLILVIWIGLLTFEML